MQIPHVLMTKEFLNKKMEGVPLLRWQILNKKISTGQFQQMCQCVKQACNMAQSRC